MFQRNAGLVLIVLVALAAPLKAVDFPGNYPGRITQTAPNQLKAQAGDRVCFFTGVLETIQISCKNYASGQTFSGSASFNVGDCHSGTFLTPNIGWSFCRLANPGVNQFEFSFDVVANLLELTGDLFD